MPYMWGMDIVKCIVLKAKTCDAIHTLLVAVQRFIFSGDEYRIKFPPFRWYNILQLKDLIESYFVVKSFGIGSSPVHFIFKQWKIVDSKEMPAMSVI